MCRRQHRRSGRFVGGPLTQELDGVQNPEPVPDTDNAHLLEGDLVEFEQNIAPDIVGPEGLAVAFALDVGQPAIDVVVGPGAQEGEVGHSCGGLDGDIGLVFEGLEREETVV